MPTNGTAPSSAELPAKTLQEQEALRAVLNSAIFTKNPRLAHLLQYICNKYFQGETETIKEYSIAADVFGRSTQFDQSTDSIVRVEVHRLRKKLREFYDGEGSGQRLEILVTTGRYLPQFAGRPPEPGAVASEPAEAEPAEGEATIGPVLSRTVRNRWIAAAIVTGALSVAIAAILWFRPATPSKERRSPVVAVPVAGVTVLAGVAPTQEVRIRCGYSKAEFRDREGNIWSGDRYYLGGSPIELPAQYVARTRDPMLYLTLRSGSFSYRIPLKPGTYEMRLHFAETTYSPASTLGGGENSRVFDVALNGATLLKQFDIVSDGGANTADVRVFKDVHPGADGYVRLDFTGTLGLPIINAIELAPALPHRLRPIRLVAQDNFYVDKSGELWSPDNYFSGGALASDKLQVSGTTDSGLYSGERYGNFSYALPVDSGRYTLTLHFAEKYWGTIISKSGGAGSRVFDVFCNGVALARGLDVLNEAGPGRALVKTWRGLRSNAQGKLIVSLVPEVNYASVDAIEVDDETE